MVDFSGTTPFYLKVSVAAMHIAGTVVALSGRGPAAGAEAGAEAGNEGAATPGEGGWLAPPWVGWLASPWVPMGGLHASLGGVAFSCVPFVASAVFVVAGMVPGAVYHAPYRGVMVDCVGFVVACCHSFLTAAKGLMPQTMRPRVLLSVFALHCSIHMLHQAVLGTRCGVGTVRRCQRVHTGVLPPVAWVGILCIHVFAVSAPHATWDLAHSMQDIVVVHALMAFVPEVLGAVYMGCSSVLRRLVDGGLHSE